MPRPNVASLERRLLEWTQRENNARQYRDAPRRQIDEALARTRGRGDLDRRTALELSIAAGLLGTWHVAAGEVEVLAGTSAGWDSVRTGIALQRCSLQLRDLDRSAPGRGSRGGDPPGLAALPAANCAAMCLAFDDPDAATLLDAVLELPDARFEAVGAWPLFVRELAALRDGRRPVVGPRLEPYGDVLQFWSGDESLLARRLAALLDLHLDRTTRTAAGVGWFEEPGLLLCPVEILAIRSVRHTLGLGWFKVEHPLMFTNLATMPPVGPWPRDPVVDALTERARRSR